MLPFFCDFLFGFVPESLQTLLYVSERDARGQQIAPMFYLSKMIGSHCNLRAKRALDPPAGLLLTPKNSQLYSRTLQSFEYRVRSAGRRISEALLSAL